MQLIYRGQDILPYVSANNIIYDMYAEARTDTLEIRLNDVKGLWGDWSPSINEKIEFISDNIKTGKMTVNSFDLKNGIYIIKAVSMPKSFKSFTNKSWSEVKFSQIVHEIAKRHDMRAELHGISDYKYTYFAQDNVDDLTFLQRLCILEGCAMVIYNDKLVIYNEAYMEKQAQVGEVELDIGAKYSYFDNSSLCFSSAEVRSGKYNGKYVDSKIDNTRIFRPDWPVKVNDEVEANRFAKNLLRYVNKNAYTGEFVQDLNSKFVPANKIKLITAKASTWDDTIFITHIRHDLIKNTTKTFFRTPLEGY